jgi:hypothetical protein
VPNRQADVVAVTVANRPADTSVRINIARNAEKDSDIAQADTLKKTFEKHFLPQLETEKPGKRDYIQFRHDLHEAMLSWGQDKIVARFVALNAKERKSASFVGLETILHKSNLLHENPEMIAKFKAVEATIVLQNEAALSIHGKSTIQRRDLHLIRQKTINKLTFSTL